MLKKSETYNVFQDGLPVFKTDIIEQIIICKGLNSVAISSLVWVFANFRELN